MRSRHDVKLRLDVECQRIATEAIQRRFPGHVIVGEEDPPELAATARPGAVRWIIDPIDGTVNFSHGLPMWCCSIAAMAGEEVVAGAVYAPMWQELFTATRGGGAFRNGQRIAVSTVGRTTESIVLTGLDKNADPRRPPLEIFRAISQSVQRARIMGCAALDICRVACGQAEGYFERGIYLWDIAAAGLICREAGGRAEILARLDGRRLEFLATNGLIHAALRRCIREAEAGVARKNVAL